MMEIAPGHAARSFILHCLLYSSSTYCSLLIASYHFLSLCPYVASAQRVREFAAVKSEDLLPNLLRARLHRAAPALLRALRRDDHASAARPCGHLAARDALEAPDRDARRMRRGVLRALLVAGAGALHDRGLLDAVRAAARPRLLHHSSVLQLRRVHEQLHQSGVSAHLTSSCSHSMFSNRLE